MPPIDGQPATPAETRQEKRERERREARTAERTRRQFSAYRGAGALDEAWREQDDAHAGEVDDLNAAGRAHAIAEADPERNPRFAARMRTRVNGELFAAQVADEFDRPRSTARLSAEFADLLAPDKSETKEKKDG